MLQETSDRHQLAILETVKMGDLVAWVATLLARGARFGSAKLPRFLGPRPAVEVLGLHLSHAPRMS